MTIDVEDVATDAQLNALLLGQLTANIKLLPVALADASTLRQWALDRTLQRLKRRTPPIFEADISDVTELRDAVLFGAAEKLFEGALSSAADGQVFHAKWQYYSAQFNSEINNLIVTGPAQERISSRGPSITRR